MNIRKTFTKLALSLTAFFWASCDDNSSEPKAYIGGGDSICGEDDESIECGGMIALYGVGPVYDESSSSITSSDSCEQGCDEMISSSSVANPESSSSGEDKSWVRGYPTEEIDLKSVRARGDSTCAEHGGLEFARQYEPEWGSAEYRGESRARSEVLNSIDEALESGELSKTKTQCLNDVKEELEGGLAAMYGSPMFENSNDIWEYWCKDGAVIKDEKYTQLYNEDQAAVNAAKEKALAEFQKLVNKCGVSTSK
ncbi:hypothetical protein [Fibrobacter sp. UWEL]|uniref:hypothetical protein n=1 Tax=Fibrobacter sp. UWEL TaxID=1896209 RepID=UPI0009229DB5|nr:hypothetical protein [Fibrobacter sp. UWEL]SHL21182.1 hypothetical protein SAMN05720468_11739 [Fibrobacter sp. UWEL]